LFRCEEDADSSRLGNSQLHGQASSSLLVDSHRDIELLGKNQSFRLSSIEPGSEASYGLMILYFHALQPIDLSQDSSTGE